MRLYYNLEKKFGRFAVPNLNKYIAVIYSIGLFIVSINAAFYWKYFSLDITKLLSGQIYRIFTFLIYPPFISFNILFSILGIYIYYNFTTALLYVWNDFKFNLYILNGIFFYIIIGIIVSFLTGSNHLIILDPSYFAFSIFIAFAFNFPDTTFLMFFILPIKAKYLALIEIVLYLMLFPNSTISDKASIIASLLSAGLFIYFIDRYSFKNFKNSLFK